VGDTGTFETHRDEVWMWDELVWSLYGPHQGRGDRGGISHRYPLPLRERARKRGFSGQIPYPAF